MPECRKRLVRPLPEALQHRRNQRILLLLANRCHRSGMAATAGQEDASSTPSRSELITHIKRFKGTKKLVRDFELIADILGPNGMLFVPASAQLRYTAPAKSILSTNSTRASQRSRIPTRQLVE